MEKCQTSHTNLIYAIGRHLEDNGITGLILPQYHKIRRDHIAKMKKWPISIEEGDKLIKFGEVAEFYMVVGPLWQVINVVALGDSKLIDKIEEFFRD